MLNGELPSAVFVTAFCVLKQYTSIAEAAELLLNQYFVAKDQFLSPSSRETSGIADYLSNGTLWNNDGVERVNSDNPVIFCFRSCFLFFSTSYFKFIPLNTTFSHQLLLRYA